MSLREEILKSIYSSYVNSDVFKDTASGEFDKIVSFAEKTIGNVERVEDLGSMLVGLEYAVFMDTANILLDFLSGNENKKAPVTDQSTHRATNIQLKNNI